MGACSLSLSSLYWREFSRIAGDGEGEHCNGSLHADHIYSYYLQNDWNLALILFTCQK